MKIATLLRDRGRLFWFLNIAGWTGYALAAWLGALAHEKPESFIRVIIVAAVVGFLATIPLRHIYRRLWTRSFLEIGLAALVICYVIAFFWQWLRNVLYYDWVKNSWQPEHLMDYVSGVMGSFYIMLCWSGLYFGIKYYRQLQDQTEQTLKAHAAAHQAQLKMLRYQLNPHFLFNTLNAISTLILDGANKTANEAVTPAQRLPALHARQRSHEAASRWGPNSARLICILKLKRYVSATDSIIEKNLEDKCAPRRWFPA